MKKGLTIALKIILTLAAAYISYIATLYISIFMFWGYFAYVIPNGVANVLCILTILIIPTLLFPVIWLKRRKRYLKYWGIYSFIIILALVVNSGIVQHEENIKINVAPNIDVYDYLPFKEKSKIVKKDSSAKITGTLPRIDGAAAVFPVYSAFVNAVYPSSVQLDDGVFNYNNTVEGYKQLAEKKTDIFFGAYPSEEQIAYAEQCGTTFEYTPIGSEGFVFFVHKNNPVSDLTSEQLRSIYAGEITNWKEVGGKDKEIAAYQRNEGSGSQSRLKRFMGDKPLMEPPTEMVNELMSGIIEQVADYKSKSNSIGFSFRYYVEGIIKNPDIKLLSVDGVAPTVENIKNGSYPLAGSLYAVTYAGNENENVRKLLDWILSPEGQAIIEETGYAGL